MISAVEVEIAWARNIDGRQLGGGGDSFLWNTSIPDLTVAYFDTEQCKNTFWNLFCSSPIEMLIQGRGRLLSASLIHQPVTKERQMGCARAEFPVGYRAQILSCSSWGGGPKFFSVHNGLNKQCGMCVCERAWNRAELSFLCPPKRKRQERKLISDLRQCFPFIPVLGISFSWMP